MQGNKLHFVIQKYILEQLRISKFKFKQNNL